MVYERWSNTQRRSRLKQLEEGYKSCTYLIESHRDSALKWLNDNNYDHDAVLAEGEAPEKVRFWLHVKRETKDVRHAIEELRDLLNEVPKEGQCSELTPGSGKEPAVLQPPARIQVSAAASDAAPQAIKHFTVGGTERPLPDLCTAAAFNPSYTGGFIRSRKREDTAAEEAQPLMHDSGEHHENPTCMTTWQRMVSIF